MTWRNAKSIDTFIKQINERFPVRNKASDGTIGNLEHKSRDSDHNAWIRDNDGSEVVSAVDITHDPTHGLDCNILAQQLIDSRDRRIKYIIWNNRIIAGKDGPAPWVWRTYHGKNKHTHHLHMSVEDSDDRYDDPSVWKFRLLATPEQVNAPTKTQPPLLRNGITGDWVKTLQRKLNEHGANLAVDGDFGPKTDRSLRIFQKEMGLVADGVAGPYTWEKLNQQEKQ